jgi:hypothetical protein
VFICEQCLRKNFTNEPSFSLSLGPCEWCKRHAACSDIPSRALHNRSKPRSSKTVKASIESEAEKARQRVRAEQTARPHPIDRMAKALGDKDED